MSNPGPCGATILHDLGVSPVPTHMCWRRGNKWNMKDSGPSRTRTGLLCLKATAAHFSLTLLWLAVSSTIWSESNSMSSNWSYSKSHLEQVRYLLFTTFSQDPTSKKLNFCIKLLFKNNILNIHIYITLVCCDLSLKMNATKTRNHVIYIWPHDICIEHFKFSELQL